MKALLAIVLCLAVANAAVFKEEEYQLLFTRFMTQYNKKYTHDTFFYRYTVFKANMDKIYLANKQKHTYTLGMNEMGDMTHAEFKATKLGYKKIDRSYARAKNSAGPHEHVKAAPTKVDWRTKNAVTPIKNQQQCGSCWAFSTTGSTEGAVAIATGKLISLSEQQLVDCSSAQGNQGCEGGLMDQAFQYIISNNGITTEGNYPYTAMDGTCNTTAAAQAAAMITGYTDVTSGSESALISAVAVGPVSVAIEADQACFQFYSSGILNDPSCGTNLDHGVLAVGYDKVGGFWIVKNSWGTSWGMSGYVEIAMGMDECGINTEPSYPTGASVPGTKHHKKH
jgi:C1A family cysteine protease